MGFSCSSRIALLCGTSLLGCGAPDTLAVQILFPGQEAFEETTELAVFALVPIGSGGCEALLSGEAAPGGVDYPVEASFAIALDRTTEPRTLHGVGPGRRLFFAEALDATLKPFLRGCRDAEAGQDGEPLILILLTRL